MKNCCIGALVICSISLVATQSYAWGRDGHAEITGRAVSHLPQPLRAYFQFHLAIMRELGAAEPPGTHWIDIDFYPEFFTDSFPRDIDDLINIYGQNVVRARRGVQTAPSSTSAGRPPLGK